jgi:hypothetical protein
MLKDSPDFTLSEGQKHGTIIIYVPSVKVKQVGKQCKALYTWKIYLIDDHEWSLDKSPKLMEGNGSCKIDDLKTCALQIVNSAKKAVRKIH